MNVAESAPSFAIPNGKTSVKMPAYYLIGLVSLTITATLAWANLSREVAELRSEMAEVRRVNSAQDKRFENLEAAQADFAVVKNDVHWLQRTAKP